MIRDAKRDAVDQLTECGNSLQGPNGSMSSRGFRSGHKPTVRAGLGRGGLSTEGTGVQGQAIFFHDGHWRPGRAKLFEKSPVKHLFGARRLGFQAIQYILIEKRARSLRHWTFLNNIVDSIQDAIGCQFALSQAIQGLYRFGKSLHGGGKAGTLFLKVFVLPMQHVPQ